MLWFLTDETRPAASTRAIVRAIAGSGVVVMFRDKRPAWDRALLADLAALAPTLVVNVGPESAEVARTHGLFGWHAPEATWRALEHSRGARRAEPPGPREPGERPAAAMRDGPPSPREPGEGPHAPVSLADHDGAGVDHAARHGIPYALVSPIWIDKGRAARGLAPFAEASVVARIALGGIGTPEQAAQLAGAGATGMAVQRALYASRDPAALAAALLVPFRP